MPVMSIPDNIPWEEAAVIEPFTIAAEAVDRDGFLPMMFSYVGPVLLALPSFRQSEGWSQSYDNGYYRQPSGERKNGCRKWLTK